MVFKQIFKNSGYKLFLLLLVALCLIVTGCRMIGNFSDDSNPAGAGDGSKPGWTVTPSLVQIAIEQAKAQDPGLNWTATETWVTTNFSQEEAKSLCGVPDLESFVQPTDENSSSTISTIPISPPTELPADIGQLPSDATIVETPQARGAGRVRLNFLSQTVSNGRDWRNYNNFNYVSPVKYQKGGTCVSYASIGLLESLNSIANWGYNFKVFSEYYLWVRGTEKYPFPGHLSPTPPSPGGWNAYYSGRFLSEIGTVEDEFAPSNSLFVNLTQAPTISEPPSETTRYRVTNRYGLYGKDVIKAYLAKSPLITSFEVYEDFFSYGGGVYKHVTGKLAGGHAVIIVGYDDNLNCWICKNSWGNNFGENGFFRIAYGSLRKINGQEYAELWLHSLKMPVRYPEANQNGVNVNRPYFYFFIGDYSINWNTVNNQTIQLQKDGKSIAGRFYSSGYKNRLYFRPDANLEKSSIYTMKVTTGFKNYWGESFEKDESWSFFTEGPPLIAIGEPSVNNTASGPVEFEITFTGAGKVTLTSADVTLNTTGTANGTIEVDGSNQASRTVRISNVIGSGTIGISLKAGIAKSVSGDLSVATGPSSTFKVQNDPPVAVLNNLPADPTNKNTATISVAGDKVTGFKYKLNQGNWSDEMALSLPISLSGLEDGSQTIFVIGRDISGNWQSDSSPSSYTWKIDSKPKVAVLTNTPTNPTNQKTARISVGGTGVVAYKYKFDTGAYGDANSISTAITLSELADGSHTVSVLGGDQVGNWQTEANASSYTWVIDSQAKVAVLSNTPTNLTNLKTANVTVGGDGVVSYKYKLDSGTYSDQIATSSVIALSGLSDGTHSLFVIGGDILGNWQLEANASSYTWVIDTQAKAAVLTNIPSNPTNSKDTNISVGGTGVVSYKYKLDSGSYGDATPVASKIALSGLADGNHKISVIGGDQLGNWQSEASAASCAWLIDSQAKIAVLSNTPNNPTSLATANISVGGTGVVSYRYKLDSGAYSDVISVSSAIALNNLSDGSHSVSVIGADQLGNWQAEETATKHEWIVDSVAPTVILANTPPKTSNQSTANFTVGGSDVVAYKYKLDTGAYSTNEIPVGTALTLSGLGDANHKIAVIGRDAVGNWQTEENAASYSWTIDSSAVTAVLANTPEVVTKINSAAITVGGTGTTHYKFKVDSGEWGAETPIATQVSFSSLSEGVHSVYVIARNSIGTWQAENSATQYTWTIDQTAPSAPTINAVTSPTNSTPQVIGGTKPSDATLVFVNGSSTSVTYPTSTTWQYSMALTSGANAISVKCRDGAGNESSAVTSSIELDSAAPVAPTINAVTSPTNSTLQVIGGTKPSDATLVFVNGSSASVTYPTSTTWQYSMALTSGANAISVKCRDGAGNESSAVTSSIELDSAAPVPPTINAVTSPTSSTPQVIGGTKPSDATLVFVNGSSASVTYPTTTTWQYSMALSAGANAISVKCKDAAGNESSAVASNIIYDNVSPTAPTSVVLTTVGGNLVTNLLNSSNVNLTAQATITAGEATGGEAELLKDGNSFSPAIKDTSISGGDTSVSFDFGLANNSEVQAKFATGGIFSVRLRDAAGNTSISTVGNPTLSVNYSKPGISAVSSGNSNGVYSLNQTIDITVTFSNAVQVVVSVGTPGLTLETGSVDRVATYQSGDGTSTLVFRYTVQAGDFTNKLDYINNAALTLNGGVIRDSSGNNAVLTLASPGSAGSLGANKTFTINTVTNYSFSGRLGEGRGNWWSGERQDGKPYGVAIDSAGNMYVSNSDKNKVFKVSPAGSIITSWGGSGSGDGQFAKPMHVALDSSGNVYVADSENYRIQKFSSAGNFIAKWGSNGSSDGQFNKPMGVAVDSSGNVYVVDTFNHRVQKFDSSGNFISKWGSFGSADDQFSYPAGAAIDSSGNIYIADGNNNRIMKFSSPGVLVGKWVSGSGSSGQGNGEFFNPESIAVDSSGNAYVADTANNRIQKLTTSGVFVTKWGVSGAGDGEFAMPYGIALDTTGNVYVADTNHQCIQKFNSSGTFISRWGPAGSADGQFNEPHEVKVDSSGNIFVADKRNHRIQKFNSSGMLLDKWGSTEGSANGQFSYPKGVAFDSSGNIYVADTSNHRIQKLNSSGGYLTQWGSSGSGNGQFTYPTGIAVDASANIYVVDDGNHRIQKFSSTGGFIGIWGSPGNGDGQFDNPKGIAIDNQGNIYVADTDNQRIQKFNSSMTFVAKWGSNGSGDGQFNYPQGIALDGVGNVYVSDTGNHRIQKFTPTGTFIAKWGSEGSTDGLLQGPYGIAIDVSGNVIIADSSNHSIEKFTP